MKASIWIESLKFKDSSIINLKKDAIVVFVGPNNAGKSRTLSEIYQFMKSNTNTDKLIIDEIKIKNQGDEPELFNLLENRRKRNQYYFVDDNGSSRAFNNDQVKQYWDAFNDPARYQYKYQLTPYFVKQMTTSQRLNLIAPPQNLNFMVEAPKHPIHFIKEDEQLEIEFSNYFKLAFGQDVIVNHGAGNIVPLHIGKRPETNIEKDRVSKAYQQDLRALGMLQDQGDGMKSFAGVFLGLFVENYSINIVDEPEAFLHPPQAQLLGQMIAKNLAEDRQIFIATHSEHLLKGLLDHADDRLVIVRIQRDDKKNKISVLENNDIQTIWKDSLLRHSNVLDGLFHSKVVLCESDSDCRFFCALSLAITENEGLTSLDILFVQSGGKDRFPVVVKALKKLEVPLTIIGDFDLYHNENPLKSIYEDMGGSWDEIKDDFKKVKQSIDQKRPELETTALRDSIEQIFAGLTDRVMPEEKIKKIEKELKKSSPWSQAKSSGKSYLPAGEATNAFNRVQDKLKNKGINILEIGELEAFDKTIGGHGPKWVNEVLTKNLINDIELVNARKFVKEIILT